MRQARPEILQWLAYYSARRRHNALDHPTPVKYEQQHHETAKLSLTA
ncbi:hypothetical protein [Streptomyces virginiae]|nr:hypothetical protein [Streptomyces virginiae]